MSSSVAIKVDQQADNNGALNDRCLCGFNIEKTVYWFAVVAVAFSLLYIVIGFVLLLANTSYYSLTMLALASYCVSIFTNMGIIFAQKQRNPDYYLPYLVYQGISLIVAAPLALYMMWPIECEYPYLTAMVLLIMIEVLQLPADGLYYLVWRAWRLLQAKNKVAVEEEEKKKKAPLLLF